MGRLMLMSSIWVGTIVRVSSVRRRPFLVNQKCLIGIIAQIAAVKLSKVTGHDNLNQKVLDPTVAFTDRESTCVAFKAMLRV
jgi:hypothetical protein